MGEQLKHLQDRGLVESVAGEELGERLASPMGVYYGCDPTADSLHLGNLIGIVVLGWLQRMGHTPIILLGGATGKIGDPSGKSTERPLLSQEVIEANIEGIRKNFFRVLDFSGKLPMPIFVNNADWYASFSFVDFLRDVGKHFRIGAMLAKESVRSRVQSEEGMSFTEFSYQLLQAYDFFHLQQHQGVHLQIGGSDQWGNITAGTEFVRKMTGKQVFGLTWPLLTRSDGKKFGKSEEGAIWLSAEKFSPYKFYQYFISVPDADVVVFLKKLTYMDLEEIQAIEEDMSRADYVPNTAQKILARQITRMVHGEEGLEVALKVTQGINPGSESGLDEQTIAGIAQDMPNVEIERSRIVGEKFVQVAVLGGLVSSKGEAMRLIQNRGAFLNEVRVEDPGRIVQEEDCIGGKFLLLGLGKKKKILVRIR